MTTCQVCGGKTRDAWLCDHCATGDHPHSLTVIIGDIGGLLHDVSDAATRQARVYRAARITITAPPDWRGSPFALTQHPLPVNLDAAAVLDAARNELATTIRDLCERRGITDRCILSGQLIGWLLTDGIAALRLDEAAGETYDRLRTLRSSLRRAVDRSPSPIFVGPCHAENVTSARTEERDGTVYVETFTIPRCDRDLYMWPGREDRIVCDGWSPRPDGEKGCGTVHTYVNRRYDWLPAQITEALQPIDVWRTALPHIYADSQIEWPHRSAWHRWTTGYGGRPARLFAWSEDDRGVPLYRGGDVIELVWSEQSRIVALREAHERRRAGRARVKAG